MRFRLVLAMTATALLAAACGSATEPAGDKPADAAKVTFTVAGVGDISTDPAIATKLPKDIRDRGTLTVATNAPYEPFIEFRTEGKTDEFKGLDYDLFMAASARLGIKATFSQQPFDGLVPGLQAGKYDAIAGGITDKEGTPRGGDLCRLHRLWHRLPRRPWQPAGRQDRRRPLWQEGRRAEGQ